MKKFLFGVLIFVLSAVAIFSYGINASAATATPIYYTGYDWNIPFDSNYPYWFVAETTHLGGIKLLIVSNSPFTSQYRDGSIYPRWKGNYLAYTGYANDTSTIKKCKAYVNGDYSLEKINTNPVSLGFDYKNTSYSLILKGTNDNNTEPLFEVKYTNHVIVDYDDSTEVFPETTDLRYKSSLPVPQKLKMYRQYAKEDAQHWSTYVSWVNPTSLPLNYKLQIEVGGKYEIREHWYSVSGTVVDVPWHNYAYSHNVYGSPFSFKNGTFKNQFTAKVKETWTGSLYEPNSFAFGYKFRLRYYYVDGDVTYYGPWAVTETNVDANDGSSNSYVTDDKGNKITNDNYTDPEDTDYNFKDDVNGQVDKDGTDYKPLGILEWVNNLIKGITDFFTSLVDMIGSLTQSVGYVPKIMGALMEGVPKPIWDTLTLGLTLVIALGVIKVLRG